MVLQGACNADREPRTVPSSRTHPLVCPAFVPDACHPGRKAPLRRPRTLAATAAGVVLAVALVPSIGAVAPEPLTPRSFIFGRRCGAQVSGGVPMK